MLQTFNVMRPGLFAYLKISSRAGYKNLRAMRPDLCAEANIAEAADPMGQKKVRLEDRTLISNAMKYECLHGLLPQEHAFGYNLFEKKMK